MMNEYAISEHGFVYMYISNHSSTPKDVYFDDVIMAYPQLQDLGRAATSAMEGPPRS
jgi:hypothetical protein